MNPKTKKKMILDIAMTVLFLLLMNLGLTGVFLHEWLGVAIVGLFAAHLAINGQWIKNVSKRFFQPIGFKAKAMFVLNVLLTLSMSLTLVSGVLISQFLFAPLAAANFDLWYTVHVFASWATLGIVASHTLVHWNWIKNVIRQAVKNPALQPMRVIAAKTMVSLFAIGAIYSMIVNPAVEMLVVGQSSTEKATTLLLSDSTSISSVDASATDSSAEVIEPTMPSVTTTTDSTPAVTSATTAVEATPTLAEYLSSFTCTLCHKHCLLSRPQCARGVRQASQYEEQYYVEYPDAVNGDV
jgi:hypothetical protein